MLEIKIDGDIGKLLKLDRDITFAAASTLTKVAGRSQDAAGEALNREFHVRRPWWKHTARYGIKIKKATKTDLESAVYTGADWLLEAEGHAAGVKTPDRHNGHLAVPDVQQTRHGIQNVVGKKEKARYLLTHPKETRAFKVTTKSGYTLILQRKGGRGGRGGNTSRVVTKYIFRKSVKVPHQSAIVEPTQKTTLTHVGPIFNDELRNAILTSRTKGTP
jgi:hypothetical protein